MKTVQRQKFRLVYVIPVVLGILMMTMSNCPKPDMPTGYWGDSRYDQAVYGK